MPTTPNKAIRYPLATDTPDVPRDALNLATDVDTILAGYEAAWTAYTPVLTAATTNPSIGAGAVFGAYKRLGSSKLVIARFRINLGAGFTPGAGPYAISLPVASLPLTPVASNYGGPFAAVGTATASETATGLTTFNVSLATTTTVLLQTAATHFLLDHTGPRGIAWTATGYIAGQVIYEAA